MTSTDQSPASIQVLLQPEEKTLAWPRNKAKTAALLLKNLGLKPGTALVIRDNILLTPDARIFTDDMIIVRTVISSG